MPQRDTALAGRGLANDEIDRLALLAADDAGALQKSGGKLGGLLRRHGEPVHGRAEVDDDLAVMLTDGKTKIAFVLRGEFGLGMKAGGADKAGSVQKRAHEAGAPLKGRRIVVKGLVAVVRHGQEPIRM